MTIETHFREILSTRPLAENDVDNDIRPYKKALAVARKLGAVKVWKPGTYTALLSLPQHVPSDHRTSLQEFVEHPNFEAKMRMLAWIYKSVKPVGVGKLEAHHVRFLTDHDLNMRASYGFVEGAMVVAGFAPVNPLDFLWRFKVKAVDENNKPRQFWRSGHEERGSLTLTFDLSEHTRAYNYTKDFEADEVA